MRVRWRDEFEGERERYGLRFCCEDCAYFDAPRECRHEWPAEQHQQAHYQRRSLEIVFCKEFELC